MLDSKAFCASIRAARCAANVIGNTDAHRKNVSFYCDQRGLRLAPAYDMICMDALDAGFPDTYAMAIGDAFTENELSPYGGRVCERSHTARDRCKPRKTQFRRHDL